MGFIDLNLKVFYSDDIIEEFYNPVLRNTNLYCRAVGFFTSGVLLQYIDSLRELSRTNGKIKLIIAPILNELDYSEVSKIYNADNFMKEYLSRMFLKFLNGSKLELTASQLFVALIQNNTLEVRFALPKNEIGIFHQKIGIFYSKDEIIAISGSNNETYGAVKKNIESFSVFCSWISGQNEYVKVHVNEFYNCWDGKKNNLRTFKMDEAINDNIINMFNSEKPVEELWEQYLILKDKEETSYNIIGMDFTPYDYQEKAAKLWIQEKKGVLKFATGSGKTKTAIYGLKLLQHSLNAIFALVLVPDKTLNHQWKNELDSYFDDVVSCFSDNNNWKVELYRQIEHYVYIGNKSKITVVTYDTFNSKKFQKIIKKLNDFIIIIDECHGITSARYDNVMPVVTYRLGLSATPEDIFDRERTNKMLEYFNGILMEYSLADAIRDNKLVGYNYYPSVLSLTKDEIERYHELSKKIGAIMNGKEKGNYKEALDTIRFNRARIIYSAENKIEVVSKIIDNIKPVNNLLVYCGASLKAADNAIASLSQLEKINNLMKKKGIPSAQYTSEEDIDDRKNGIRAFRNRTFKVLTAIKCLDEGVDIPEIENAIIIASSQNPREFIQRRGRLLRKSPGKTQANIYDLVVITDDKRMSKANEAELKRVKEFMKLSLNMKEIEKIFEDKFIKYL